ncbi:MAG: hypothetical protein LBV19_08570 [Streptococcaceae bacterium]|jgi:Rgg/GadR/MutR family transcriptional activator|nr:hypothetical protein [Streptococcaceae bacterium]
MDIKLIGKTFKELRLAKGISQSSIVSVSLSQPALSRFEAGKSSLAVDKFFSALENASITPEEFYRYAQLKQNTKNPLYTADIVLAQIASNSEKMKKFIKLEEERFAEEGTSIDRLMLIYSKTLLELVSREKIVTHADINYAFNYLLSINNWSRIEIRLASAFVNIFSDQQLSSFIDVLFKRTRLFCKDVITQEKFYELIHNLLDCLVQRKRFAEADRVIKKINLDEIPDLMTLPKLFLIFNKSLVAFYQGNQQALANMEEIYEFCERFGFKQFAQAFKVDIESCKKT